MSGATRRPLVAANWKMNLDEAQAARLLRDLLPRLAEIDAVDTAIAPSFVSIPKVRELLSRRPPRLAAQNMHWEASGAFTGEVSPVMLRAAGVEMVIIGHSERRALFGETDTTVQRKTEAALDVGLAPILCVGETESERDTGRSLEVVQGQLDAALAGLTDRIEPSFVLAYEPVWAIGTGRSATPEQVDEMHRMLRGRLEAILDAGRAGAIRILYGGSVSPDNAAGLLGLPDVDGALVGGASLSAEKFAAIVRAARAG